MHGDKVQLALVGEEGWWRGGGGGTRSKWDHCNGSVPWKIAFLSPAFSRRLLAPVRVNGIFNSLVWVEGWTGVMVGGGFLASGQGTQDPPTPTPPPVPLRIHSSRASSRQKNKVLCYLLRGLVYPQWAARHFTALWILVMKSVLGSRGPVA